MNHVAADTADTPTVRSTSMLRLTLYSSLLTGLLVLVWSLTATGLIRVIREGWFGRDGMYVLAAATTISMLLTLSSAVAAAPAAVLARCSMLARAGVVAANLALASVSLAMVIPDVRGALATAVTVGMIGYLLVWFVAGQAVGLAAMAAVWKWSFAPTDGNSTPRPLTIRGLLCATAAVAILLASPRPVAAMLQNLVLRRGDAIDPLRLTHSVDSIVTSPLLYVLAMLGLVTSPAIAGGLWCLRSRYGWYTLIGCAVLLTLIILGIVIVTSSASTEGTVEALLLVPAFFAASLVPAMHTQLWHWCGWRLTRIRRDVVPVQAADSEVAHGPGVP